MQPNQSVSMIEPARKVQPVTEAAAPESPKAEKSNKMPLIVAGAVFALTIIGVVACCIARSKPYEYEVDYHKTFACAADDISRDEGKVDAKITFNGDSTYRIDYLNEEYSEGTYTQTRHLSGQNSDGKRMAEYGMYLKMKKAQLEFELVEDDDQYDDGDFLIDFTEGNDEVIIKNDKVKFDYYCKAE